MATYLIVGIFLLATKNWRKTIIQNIPVDFYFLVRKISIHFVNYIANVILNHTAQTLVVGERVIIFKSFWV